MRTVFFLLIATIFSNCQTPKTSDGNSGTLSKRYNRLYKEKAKTSDSIAISGAQYIPLYGKRESGVSPDIQGLWVLETMDGVAVKGDDGKKLDSIAAAKKTAQSRKDSITYSRNSNGVQQVITEVVLDQDGNTKPKITPPQGSNYHIPEKPTISFYGSNETFSGFTGCNRFSGRYEMPDSNSLSLKAATPSTKMVCLGDYDENKFIDYLHRVTKFKGTDERLELMDGDKVIMTFTRKSE